MAKTKRDDIQINLKSSLFCFWLFEQQLFVIALALLVIPAGFEPTTHSLEGCCSIQLSYGTNVQKWHTNFSKFIPHNKLH